MKKNFGLFIFFIIILLSACSNKNYLITLEVEGSTYLILHKQEGLIDVSNLPKPVEDLGYLFSGWYNDRNFENLAEDFIIKNNTTLYGYFNLTEEMQVLEEIEIPDYIEEDIVLPNKTASYNLIWESSNPALLSNDGIYKNVTFEDQGIILKVRLAGTEYFKDFPVIIKAYPVELAANKVISSINFSKINKNIILPSKYGLFTATWSSSKPDIISNNGLVNLTYQEEEVVLTLQLSYLTYTKEVTFTVETEVKVLTVQDSEYFAKQANKLGLNEKEPFLTNEQINNFNQSVLNSSNTNTTKLDTLPQTITKANLTSMIEKYININSYPIYDYLSGKVISTSDKTVILNNRNLNAINESTNIRYGISVDHTNLRSYPTNHYSNSNAIDRFQETGFGAGIPMIIYHTSLDGEWLFVRMFNYAGWVETKNVALTDRNTFLKFVNPSNFIVILAPIIKINNVPVRMGTVLPVNESNAILFPSRKASGDLEIIYPSITQENYHHGYLPLTYLNLFNQAYKFLNYSYSWGDKNPNGLDCSSTQGAIYACFGINLGRNTSNQWATATYGQSISSPSVAKISSYKPGTLIYTSSHVLMYLGVDDAGDAWVLHNTSDGNKCKLQTLKSYSNLNGINHVLIINVL